MKIERVDEKTVKCYLTGEELEAYQIDYKDFLTRTPKAKEVVQEIITQAVEEVGYKPPKFAFDLQIMMLPDKGMVLTFSEKDPMESPEGKEFLKALKHMNDTFDEMKKESKELPKPEQAVFEFQSISDIIHFAKTLPKGLRVVTALYKMNEYYYLMLHKGSTSYDRYSRICICAMEYGLIYGADDVTIRYVEEHGQCLMPEKVLNRFRNM